MSISYFIGVDVGGTNLRAARFRGQQPIPDAKVKVPSQPGGERDHMLDRLEQAIREVAPPDLADVAGIGLGIPGPVDPHTGMVINITNIPGWKNLPLQQIMQERLGRPVFLGNDANLAALGEWKFGAGRGQHDVLYLTVSTGIGGGIITGDRLLLGAHGLGAEVGHVMVQPNGPRCGCGLRGCVEALAAGPAITRQAQARLAAGEGAASALRTLTDGDLTLLTTALIGQAALNGDGFAQALFAEAGGHLGAAIAGLLHIFNPAVVILGGGVSFVGDVFFEPVRAAVRQHTMNDLYWRNCPIVPAALGDDAGLVGAGALAMEESRARVLPDR
ncbi:MAG: ROK family protein [Anaerolineales bacterium]|nr:ROK family protein [Anaerolineales bacterium]